VIAVPNWTASAFEAAEAALLVEVSDAPVLHLLGFYREQQGA